jgi:hypothetical protein
MHGGFIDLARSRPRKKKTDLSYGNRYDANCKIAFLLFRGRHAVSRTRFFPSSAASAHHLHLHALLVSIYLY